MNLTRPHICFVAPNLYPVLAAANDIQVIGGAEVQQAILARAFVRAGCRVTAITLDFGQPDEIELDGIQVLKAYRYDAGLPVLRFIHPRLTAIWSALGRADADIYYQRSSSMLTGTVVLFCRRHGRRSIYAGAHDLDFDYGNELIRFGRDKWLFRWGVRHADTIVVQNPHQAVLLREHYGREGHLINSCYWSPKGVSHHSSGGSDVLWVSTLRKFKRPERILALARRLPHLHFRVIGGRGSTADEVELYRQIETEAARLSNVSFMGFQPLTVVEQMFDQARLFVNTSDSEGFPNTFLQAWARGIPCISLFDTGSRWLGATVLELVENEDDAASRIDRLLRDENVWRIASDRSRSFFDANHSPEGTVEAYLALFSVL